ncbi:MAG: sigma-70 family RNA polymerase sigma factor [Myxococcales bacterium]|nr:sigma-70 family RNA polymerase sigma factor [Myxococcales bacterium]
MGKAQSELHTAWNQFAYSLKKFLHNRVGNEAEAQDILQEVFLKLCQQAHKDALPQLLGPWLFRTARNTMIDRIRRHSQSDPIPENLPAPGPDIDTQAVELESKLGRWLQAQVKALPPPYAEAIHKVDIEGGCQRQIAVALNIPYSTFKSRVHRGRAQLRAVLRRCCLVEWDAQGRVRDVQPRQAKLPSSCASLGHTSAGRAASKTHIEMNNKEKCCS